ncbi:50S ribosomal protein L32e [Thermogymnomonas acidicola]|uniref:Large ribosomal subunit protein eL32 n=2 Tax=Thermogymnomonas acidicola TaxID=399579 RepID=A0AA37F987_9ARCH|nr:50S ribosomal protein L32e [Thermogymnomonas acidicola]
MSEMNTLKPSLSEYEKRLLKIKVEQARKRPAFRRQEWFRYKKLGDAWRKPRGKHSKMREHLARRPPVVDSGFRSPRIVRGLHPSGFREVLVNNVSELERLDRNREAARIASKVGAKKREAILKRADELGIRVINRGSE